MCGSFLLTFEEITVRERNITPSTGKSITNSKLTNNNVDSYAIPKIAFNIKDVLVNSIDAGKDWTNKGEMKVGDDNISINYSINSSVINKDRSAFINDYVRFLGRLHDNGVDTISYKGVEYTWDDSSTLKSSKFINNKVALISVMNSDTRNSLSANEPITISMKVNNVDMTTVITIVNDTIDNE